MRRPSATDLQRLYLQMARMRALEVELGRLWAAGRISGELHLGIGEEAAVAGVLDHLVDGDALAVDHRSTPPFVARGTTLTLLAAEVLGSPAGLCGGQGGHMHLFDPEQMTASSGIVGASGPLACGFALAATYLRRGAIAVAFFGEGAVNQGMLMESLNLASVWALPLVFVCKDNGMAITTRSRSVTAGRLKCRAASFGIPATCLDGSDVAAVWRAAGKAVARARAGRGPTFLQVRCRRPEGHFQGDPLLRVSREPRAAAREIGLPLIAAVRASPGAPFAERVRALAALAPPVLNGAVVTRLQRDDPLRRTQRRLGRATTQRLDAQALDEVSAAVATALKEAEVG